MVRVTYTNELQHHGIKGMRWGVRRYQTPDGTLTAAGQKRRDRLEAKERKKAVKAEAKTNKKVAKQVEQARKIQAEKDEEMRKATVDLEKRRASVLKSTDANEIFKNRDILTTNEINERINRINAEMNLSNLASKGQKSAYDKGMNFVNKSLAVGRKVNEIYEFGNTSVMKALKKKLGFKTDDKFNEFTPVSELLKAGKDVSSDILTKALKRQNTIKALEKLEKEMNEGKIKEGKTIIEEAKEDFKKTVNDNKEVNDYNERWRRGESDDKVTPGNDSSYNARGNRDTTNPFQIPQFTSAGPNWSTDAGRGKIYDGEFREITSSPSSSFTSDSSSVSAGQSYVAQLGTTKISGLLEAPRDDD